MYCRNGCQNLSKTFELIKPAMIPFVSNVIQEHGYGDLILRTFPDGMQELRLGSEHLVAVQRHGRWVLRRDLEIVIMDFLPVDNEEALEKRGDIVVTLCYCGVKYLVDAYDEKSVLSVIIAQNSVDKTKNRNRI